MKSLTRGIKHNTHPGEILKTQIIDPNNLTIEATAKLLGITKATLSEIVNASSSITPLIAIKISKVFGGTPSLWIKM